MELELDARLRAFAAYARRESFSRAADELAISQPAVSRHVADLEARLRLTLVDRQARRGGLTAGGRYLAEAVLRAEGLLSQAERGVAAFRSDGVAKLAIVASGTPGTYLVPALVSEFHAAHPGIELEVLMATSAAAVEMVRNHKAEVGIVGGFADSAEMEASPLVDDEIVVVAAPGAADGRSRRDFLSVATWVSREEGSATRSALEAAWRDLGITPRSRLELPSWEAVKLLVARGGAVAACSTLAIDVELRAGVLEVLDVPGWRIHRTISVVRARDAPLTPPARDFLDLLKGLANGGAATQTPTPPA
ncbi:MAG: LysR substrate-binding domain-containing protein [Dehalococcoidia bacterium]